jgi:hypothetical protein
VGMNRQFGVRRRRSTVVGVYPAVAGVEVKVDN